MPEFSFLGELTL